MIYAGENKIEIKTNKEDQKIVIKPNSLELSHRGCSISVNISMMCL